MKYLFARYTFIFIVSTVRLSSAFADPSTDIVVTVAGTANAGYTGDGGNAALAELSVPQGMVFDAAGNLYISDKASNAIRKVTADQTISSFVASGLVSAPVGLAINGDGNLYVAESGQDRILAISLSDGTPTVFSNGGGDCGNFNQPTGVAFDKNGTLYVVDSGKFVRAVSGSQVTTVFGNCHGVSDLVAGIAVNAAGTVYFADRSTNQIYSIDNAGVPTPQASISGNTGGWLGLAFDQAGDLFVAASTRHVVYAFDTSLNLTTIAGDGTSGYSGDRELATSAEFVSPFALAVNSDGRVFIADSVSNVVREVGPSVLLTVSVHSTNGLTDVVQTGDHGLTCVAPNTCQQNYIAGSEITLNTNAVTGNIFYEWAGGGCSGNGSCTAITLSDDSEVGVAAYFSTRDSNGKSDGVFTDDFED